MSYPGGKNGTGVYQRIINHMPPHRTYVEPFLGGGAIMRMKKPAISSIGIDADGDVISQWRNLVTPPNLTLLQGDALDWLANHTFSDDTLIYLDPPYLFSTRSSHRPIYRYEFSDEQHLKLLRIINLLPCMVMISGYYSEMYGTALSGPHWCADRFMTRTRGGRMAEEWLWMNFPEPTELHDYRYLGTNFRERERIKRKTQRWKNRLITMDIKERYAIMCALSELKRSYIVNSDDVARVLPGPARHI